MVWRLNNNTKRAYFYIFLFHIIFGKAIAQRFRSSGYPQGLKGAEIPVAGRLMAVADVYDALITKRVYKSALSNQQAIDIIREGRGTAFDPEIVDLFLQFEEEFHRIALEFDDSTVGRGK